MIEESETADEFISELERRLVNSSLKVVTPEGEEIVLDDYQPPIYTIEIPDGNSEVDNDVENEGNTFIENIKEGYFPWWLLLILAAIIAALFDFIHELITRRSGQECPKPIPAKAVAQIAKGARVVADFSGSMAAQQSETAKACQAAHKGSDTVLCFGDSVSEHAVSELKGLQATGKTHGWEAMEQAAFKGWDEIVLVSDLGFNGKIFDENAFAGKFRKVTVVTPSSYDIGTLENIKKIADEVEVLYL